MASFNDVKIDPIELLNGNNNVEYSYKWIIIISLSGCSADDIFNGSEQLGLTFDDLICLPDQIDFGVHEVSYISKIIVLYDI